MNNRVRKSGDPDCPESEIIESQRVGYKIRQAIAGEDVALSLSAMANTLVFIMVNYSDFTLDEIINGIKMAHEGCLEEAKSGSH